VNRVKSAKLSKEEWLTAALEAVSRDGGAKLRIDALVKELGVSKGSFYWHFKNRKAFMHDLIEYWHLRSTLVVSDNLDQSQAPPEQKLQALVEMVFVEELTRHDLAIRSWAIQEPAVRAAVKRTDLYRMNYVRALFLGIGFAPEDAEFRAQVFVSEATMEGAVFDRLPKSARKQRARKFYELLIRQ
jgi:AcrR family transcriptional regulator